MYHLFCIITYLILLNHYISSKAFLNFSKIFLSLFKISNFIDGLIMDTVFFISLHGKFNLALCKECVYQKRISAPAGKTVRFCHEWFSTIWLVLTEIGRSKILQRALLNSKKSICDPCKILSAPFKSAPAQQQERGAGGMCAHDYIIRIIGWKRFWRDPGFFSLPGSWQVLSVG